jgi:hypothetical protein
MDGTGIKLKGPEVVKLIEGNFASDLIRLIGNPQTLAQNNRLFNNIKTFFALVKKPRKDKAAENTYITKVRSE